MKMRFVSPGGADTNSDCESPEATVTEESDVLFDSETPLQAYWARVDDGTADARTARIS